MAYQTIKEAIVEAERRYWTDLLIHTQGCVTHAARLAGIERQNVYRTIARLGVSLPRRKFRGHWAGIPDA